jgi:hypothetical protein
VRAATHCRFARRSAARANPPLSRRLAWNYDAGRIGTSNDYLGLRHTVRLDKLIERGGVRQRETDATVGHGRAEAGMVRAMNAVPPFGEEDRVGHASVVSLLRIVHYLHAEGSVGADRG